MNKSLVFANAQFHYGLILGYFLYYVILLGVTLVALYGCIDWLKINPYLAQVLVTLLTALMSYNILRLLFARRDIGTFDPISTGEY